MQTDGFLGMSPDDLTLVQRRQMAGKWLALRRYTPANLALRRIEAIGDSPSECQRALRDAAKDPAQYQFVLLTAPR